MISRFTTQYLPPLLFAIMVMLAILLVIAWLGQRGEGWAGRLWRGIVQQRVAVGFFCAAVLFSVAFLTFVVRLQADAAIHKRYDLGQSAESNLISSAPLPIAPLTHTVTPLPPPLFESQATPQTRDITYLEAKTLVATNVIVVQPGTTFRLGLMASAEVSDGKSKGAAQTRVLWFTSAMNPTPLSYIDSPVWEVQPYIRYAPDDYTAQEFHTEAYQAPPGATRLQIEVRNVGDERLVVRQLTLTAEGAYVEPHPNGTQGAIAFSFDWESAMGGAIHSQGMEVHDVAGATQHGWLMRQGADWLNKLFKENNIHATFYATGYNMLDGNAERDTISGDPIYRTFSGDPLYKWAKPKNGWSSDYWLSHKWFSDDPFGTYESDPAWYFGDQTRALLQAGHEIAPHTFGHIYVRGSNPEELSTDMDQWLSVAKAAGVPAPTTFAFPWRSSNSLTADFYDVLYQRGIRAVTRLYAPDLRDFYTLGAAPVYSNIVVMPDFLLGAPSSNAGEEASGAPIGLDQGLAVINEVLARRGTTSFWTHPEQLGDHPSLKPVQDAWKGVVEAAAKERDAGRLWIATVAEITSYQRNVMSVTVTLDHPLFGGWKMIVTNNSGQEIDGVTLTLPGDATHLSSQDAEISTVVRDTSTTHLSPPNQPVYPARQIVIPKLKPGVTTIEVEWAQGQEPQL